MTCKSCLMSSSQKHGYTVLLDNFIFCLLSSYFTPLSYYEVKLYGVFLACLTIPTATRLDFIKAEFKESALDTVETKW